MAGSVALWVGFVVVMVAGSVAHELTHYAVARLAGAKNVRLHWPRNPFKRPYVYYEHGGLGSTIRIVNLAPLLIGVGWAGLYLLLYGLPPFTTATVLAAAFLFGYTAFGGIEDYLHDRALRHE